MTLATLFLAFAVVLVSSPIALAHEVNDMSNHDDTTSTSSDDSAVKTTADTDSRTHDMLEKFKKTAQEKNKTQRENVKQRSAEARQKSCEARKAAMTNRLNRKVSSAEKHKSVFDNALTRVKAFHDSKNLNTPGYNDLVAKVEAAQTEASNQVAALKVIDINIDCTKANVGDTVSTFREALAHTRDALKTYRSTLVDLIKAVHESNNQ